jgi:ankyrin repeat protein
MNTILKEEVKRVFCNCEGDNDVEDLIERLRGAPKESLHQLLIKMIMFKSLPLVQLVVESGAEIEEPIGEGITPLLYACQEGQLEIVDYLVKLNSSSNKD